MNVAADSRNCRKSGQPLVIPSSAWGNAEATPSWYSVVIALDVTIWRVVYGLLSALLLCSSLTCHAVVITGQYAGWGRATNWPAVPPDLTYITGDFRLDTSLFVMDAATGKYVGNERGFDFHLHLPGVGIDEYSFPRSAVTIALTDDGYVRAAEIIALSPQGQTFFMKLGSRRPDDLLPDPTDLNSMRPGRPDFHYTWLRIDEPPAGVLYLFPPDFVLDSPASVPEAPTVWLLAAALMVGQLVARRGKRAAPADRSRDELKAV